LANAIQGTYIPLYITDIGDRYDDVLSIASPRQRHRRGCANSPLSGDASAIVACTSCSRRDGIELNHKKLYRPYAEERRQVCRRGGRKRALGTRALLALSQGRNSAGRSIFCAIS